MTSPVANRLPVLRRKARILALQILYQRSVASAVSSSESLDYAGRFLDADDDALDYARRLIACVTKNVKAWDASIETVTQHWKLSRMAIVDRNILRLALAERQAMGTPKKVILNEAIEIAKCYSTGDSGRFINGVLDHLFQSEIQDEASRVA